MSKDSKNSKTAKKDTRGDAKKGASQSAAGNAKKLGLLARLHMAMLTGIMGMTNPADVIEDNAVDDEAKKGNGLSRE